jgi:hypothetical protein
MRARRPTSSSQACLTRDGTQERGWGALLLHTHAHTHTHSSGRSSVWASTDLTCVRRVGAGPCGGACEAQAAGRHAGGSCRPGHALAAVCACGKGNTCVSLPVLCPSAPVGCPRVCGAWEKTNRHRQLHRQCCLMLLCALSRAVAPRARTQHSSRVGCGTCLPGVAVDWCRRQVGRPGDHESWCPRVHAAFGEAPTAAPIIRSCAQSAVACPSNSRSPCTGGVSKAHVAAHTHVCARTPLSASVRTCTHCSVLLVASTQGCAAGRPQLTAGHQTEGRAQQSRRQHTNMDSSREARLPSAGGENAQRSRTAAVHAVGHMQQQVLPPSW